MWLCPDCRPNWKARRSDNVDSLEHCVSCGEVDICNWQGEQPPPDRPDISSKVLRKKAIDLKNEIRRSLNMPNMGNDNKPPRRSKWRFKW